MDVIATTAGVYPLPDDAKEILADLKGRQRADLIDGTRDDPDRAAAYDDIRAELVAAQRDAGLDRFVEGQARWDDMIAHPIVVHPNVEPRGLVRYYDNNNFYRDPVVTGPLDTGGDAADAVADIAGDLEAAVDAGADPGALQAVLPGPYTLADLATDDHYGDDRAFLDAVTDYLAAAAGACPDAATLFLLEPSLSARGPAGDAAEGATDAGPFADGGAAASEAIDAVAGATDAEVVAHTYWGAPDERVHAHLLDAGIDAVGYDLVTAHEDAVYLMNEYGTRDTAAFGVVDGQNTRVEGPDEIHDRLDWVADNTPGADVERAYVLPNTELFYLPTATFREKLDALGAATREVAA